MLKRILPLLLVPSITNAAEDSIFKQNIDQNLLNQSFKRSSNVFEMEDISTLLKSDSNQRFWTNRDNWKRVRQGMSFEEVRRILGEPTKMEIVTPNVVTWYYEGQIKEGYAPLSGHVFFGSSIVSFLKEPDF